MSKNLTVNYKGNIIVSMAVDTDGVKTLLTSGKYLEDDIVITIAEDSSSYTNLIPLSTEVSSSAIYNNGLGYKNGYYISVGKESANENDCMTGCIPYDIGNTQPTDILYIKGYTGRASNNHTRLCIRNSDKTRISEFSEFLDSNNIFDVETLGTGYYKLTPKTGVHNRYQISYVQFSFHQPDASGIIITRNEPIE